MVSIITCVSMSRLLFHSVLDRIREMGGVMGSRKGVLLIILLWCSEVILFVSVLLWCSGTNYGLLCGLCSGYVS